MRYKFKTTPFKHQLRAVKRALRQGHLGLLWQPGTGKTKVIVDWSSALFLRGELTRVLIAAPLSVVGVWQDEYRDHCPVKYSMHILDKDDEVMKFKGGHLQILVVNYDLAWRREKAIKKFKPQMVIADESHKIKKASARRSKYMRQWKKAKYRAILTGTPTPKSFLDLYSQWVFLNYRTFGTNISEFKHRYIIFGGFMNHAVKGYSNFKELNAKVKSDASILRKDQCLDLPPQVFQRVPVWLEPEALEAYQKMAYELFLELKNGEVSDAANAAVKILRLQQITGGYIKSDEGNVHRLSTAKLAAATELLEGFYEQSERVVVFCRFLPELDDLYRVGIKLGFTTYMLRGGVRRQERDRMRVAFQSGKGPSLFLAQIQTGGLGITLHSAHEVLFYSVTYALDDYIQACDRVHRNGQTEKVTYRHLVAAGTVDLDIYAALKGKRDVMNLIMGKPEVLTRRFQVDNMASNERGSR